MRWIRSVACVALCVFACVAAARAASQITGIRVQPSTGANVVISIAFNGAVPPGWHLIGIGTRVVTVALPMTTLGVTEGRVTYPGANAVQSVHVSAGPGQTDIVLELTAVVPVFSAINGNTLSIVVAPPPPTSPSYHAAATRPVSAVTHAQSYVVVPLKYADVSEVVGILVPGQTIPPNDTFQTAGSIFTLPTSPGVSAPQMYQSTPTLAQQQPQSVGERITDNIAIDRRLNAIVLTGTPAEIAALQAEIAQIDVPLPSVMLVCEVVELSQTAAHDLGLDFTSGGAGTQVGSAGATLSTSNMPAFHADFQASLFATIAHGGGQILATPRVVALNGTAAQILTGDALPIVSTTIYPGPPTITQQTVNYIAVGINLQIQPRITSDHFVTSHIFAEVSSVTAYVPTQQGNVPQISLRQATTMATVSDGQPFVIGGLLQDQEIRNLSKLPGVGDLPLIGGLFRVRHDTETRTNLYILITPHIIEPGASPAVPALPKPNVPGPTPAPY